MARTPVAASEATEATEAKTHYAVFGINEHFTLGLWALAPSALPEGHEAFMREATESEIAMARHLVKSL